MVSWPMAPLRVTLPSWFASATKHMHGGPRGQVFPCVEFFDKVPLGRRDHRGRVCWSMPAALALGPLTRGSSAHVEQRAARDSSWLP